MVSRTIAAIAMAALVASPAFAERYDCTADAIRACSPAGCKDLPVIGSMIIDVTARSYKICADDICRQGTIDASFGRLKATHLGMMGFSETGVASGFGGSIDFDTGLFTLIDGENFWSGRCVAAK